MKMTINEIDLVLKQFHSRSSEARQGAIRYFVKIGTLPAQVRPELVRMFNTAASWDKDLIMLIVSHPCPEFESLYRTLLSRGGATEQALSLQYLSLWMDSQERPFAQKLLPVINSMTESDDPWIAFLAALQSARLYNGGKEAWIRAARAIIAADQMDWWNNIRSQAAELVSHDERQYLNECLQDLNALVIGEPKPSRPFPWEKNRGSGIGKNNSGEAPAFVP